MKIYLLTNYKGEFMKLHKPFLTFFLVCFNVLMVSNAQTYTGNLNLTTQAEVDAFNYTEVTGSLYIYGTDITDLSPLSNLVSVGGQLGIVNNTTLTTINGFSSLITAGEILIDENPLLQSFSDFHSLVFTAGGNIEIYHNVSLKSFSGFEVLQTVGWTLEIGSNQVLTEIPNFNSLQTINSSLFIYENPSLTSITSFNALQYVDYSFGIWNNPTLGQYCAFYNFFNVNSGVYPGSGFLTIFGNLVNPTIQDIIDIGPCPTPEELIDDLQSSVVDLGLPNGLENSLTSSLNNAKKSLSKGNYQVAINQLEAFINKVESQSGKKIDKSDADDLIAAAQSIVDELQSSIPKSSNEQALTSSDITPQSYSLDQNYPNPFNPSTVIQYGIPTASNVRIEVFNTTGEKVATLVDGFKSEGYYEVSFNASGLPSGMYLYRISAGTFKTTKKMVLMK